MILYAIGSFGCSVVVWIFATFCSHTVIEFQRLNVKEDFDVIVELEGLFV